VLVTSEHDALGPHSRWLLHREIEKASTPHWQRCTTVLHP
jgi:hypothetical protein